MATELREAMADCRPVHLVADFAGAAALAVTFLAVLHLPLLT